MPYYAVHKGHTPGIYNSWETCKKNTEGYSGSLFKKFTDKGDAKYFLKHGNEFKKDKSKSKSESKRVQTDKKIKVYTDGACSNNGSSIAKAGIGIYFGEIDKRNVSKRVAGKQTNNVAELTAILEVSNILETELNKGVEVEIYTDSTYSIKCCTTYGEKQDIIGWTKSIPNKELVKIVYETYIKYPNVSFKHIKAHTGKTDIDSLGNDNADRLANESINIKSEKSDKSDKSNIKIYLDISYENKEKIKLLGGKWDDIKKQGYIINRVIEDEYVFSEKEVKKITKFFSKFS